MTPAAPQLAEVLVRRNRLWLPLVAAPWRPAAVPATPPIAGKTIVICCDGTGNDPKEMDDGVIAPTNVYNLYKAVNENSQFGTRQIAWYDPGVGTGNSRLSRRAGFLVKLLETLSKAIPSWLGEFVSRLLLALESATGTTIEENIEKGYREIVRNFQPGDRIFIFGFSRGAYAARCIAGVIQKCGLLKPENIRFAADAVTLYRRRKSGALASPILDPGLIHPPGQVRVHVLGLWDTVASLGLPLWGWWFRIGAFWRNKNLDSNPAAVCENVYHAMSMDEQRSQFFPTVTTPDGAQAAGQTIRQVWFRGAHADIGGGYANRCLADVTFEWMVQICWRHGLRIRSVEAPLAVQPPHAPPICPDADPMGNLHDEIATNPRWIIFGSWPRWTPVPRPGWTDRFQNAATDGYGTPHDLVYRRAERASQLWRRREAARRARPGESPTPRIDAPMGRDGLVFLGIDQSVRVSIAAQAVWNRTAIVFESAAIYRIAHVGGTWRDAEDPPCGPDGQEPGLFDVVRRLFWRTRRVQAGNWLELIGHIAHPRSWPILEFGLRRLLTFVFWRPPDPLAKSLMRIGQAMRTNAPGVYRPVHVVNFAHGGQFYAFANDAWATYGNNSGAIELEITRVAAIPAGGVTLVVTPRGEIVSRAETPPAFIDLAEQRSAILADEGDRPGRVSWPPLTPDPAAIPDPQDEAAEAAAAVAAAVAERAAAAAAAAPQALAPQALPSEILAFADPGPLPAPAPPAEPPPHEAVDAQLEAALGAHAAAVAPAPHPLAALAANLVRPLIQGLVAMPPMQGLLGAVPLVQALAAAPAAPVAPAWSAEWQRDEV